MELPPYLAVLNEEQQRAVLHTGSSLLILAGAGSGKTRVITTKIAYLIREQGFDPHSILAVTFTNKAAVEMAERARLIEPRAQYAVLRTFHSFGAWFLRRNAKLAGLSNNFVIYDEEDSANLIASLPEAKDKQKADVKTWAHQIARAKDYFLGPEDAELSRINYRKNFKKVYQAYENRLLEIGNVDFGDLIKKPIEILRNNPSLAEDYRDRFRVVMVDEYQDANIAQFALLKELSGDKTYVCVVGDDDQSIYRFRGAEVRNILEFPDRFPGTDVIRLEKNYRSTSLILKAASSVVGYNKGRLGKTLFAERGDGKMPVLAFLPNQDEEAAFAAQVIESSVNQRMERERETLRGRASYSDWAVLYRTNAQSPGFETEFLRRRIPYRVIGSLKFYDREEVKDSLALLSLIVNPRDIVAFHRVVNKPSRGIGAATIDKIITVALDGDLLSATRRIAPELPGKARKGAESFLNAMEIGRAALNGDNPLESLSKDALSDESDRKEARKEQKRLAIKEKAKAANHGIAPIIGVDGKLQAPTGSRVYESGEIRKEQKELVIKEAEIRKEQEQRAIEEEARKERRRLAIKEKAKTANHGIAPIIDKRGRHHAPFDGYKFFSQDWKGDLDDPIETIYGGGQYLPDNENLFIKEDRKQKSVNISRKDKSRSTPDAYTFDGYKFFSQDWKGDLDDPIETIYGGGQYLPDPENLFIKDARKQESVDIAHADKSYPAQDAHESAGTRTKKIDEKLRAGQGLSLCVVALVKATGVAAYHLSHDEIAGEQRVANLQELANAASLYPATEGGLSEFLEHIELDRSMEEKHAGNAADVVTLITLHNTKGLEFRRVIMTGVEQGVFPRDDKEVEDLEEERRLFYVGATRAMNELYFTSCAVRRIFGRTRTMEPSVFLSEIDAATVRIIGRPPYGFKSKKITANTESRSQTDTWEPGQRVFNDDHGYGSVIEIRAHAEGPVLVVRFDSGKKMSFLSRHHSSKLTKVRK